MLAFNGDNTFNGKPLFRAAIMQSGAVRPSFPLLFLADPRTSSPFLFREQRGEASLTTRSPKPSAATAPPLRSLACAPFPSQRCSLQRVRLLYPPTAQWLIRQQISSITFSPTLPSPSPFSRRRMGRFSPTKLRTSSLRASTPRS